MSDRPHLYASLPEPQRSVAIRAHDALHILWSKAVGTPDYVKREWNNLGGAIEELVNLTKGVR